MSLKLDSRWSYDVFQMICHRTLMLRNSYTFCWMAVCKKLRCLLFCYTTIKQTQNYCYWKNEGGLLKKNQTSNVFLRQKNQRKWETPQARESLLPCAKCNNKKKRVKEILGMWKEETTWPCPRWDLEDSIIVVIRLSSSESSSSHKGCPLLVFFFFLLSHFTFCPFLFVFL